MQLEQETQLLLTNRATHLCQCNGMADLIKTRPSLRVLPRRISFIIFIALVSEEPSPQCMCNIYVQFSNIFPAHRWKRVWTFEPRPDPTRTLFEPLTRPGHWVSVLWIERLFWWRCATRQCFLINVSVLCNTHTDHENVQHNYLSLFSTEE